MKTILLSLFIFLSTFSFCQTKYFIYFKDKSIKPGEALNKTLPDYSDALKTLNERAIQRRIKTSGEENIITYEDLPVKKEYKEKVSAAGIKILRELTWFNAVSAYLSDEQIVYLLSLPFVEKIEKVKAYKYRNENIIENSLHKPVIDLNYGNSIRQVSLSEIPPVHRKGITGEGVLIGLLDTGYDWRDHEALSSSDVIAEYDFIFDDDNTADEPEDLQGQHSHGTIVFSIVGGFKEGELIGPAYNASYLLAKTEDIRGEKRVEEDNYAAALIWMENQGVDITSSSLGYNDFDDGFSYTYQDMNGNTAVTTKAVNIAFEKGIVTLTAAGNEGSSPWRYILSPADAYNIIAVGGVSPENNVNASSSRGPTSDGRIKPEIVAMGSSVYAAIHTGVNNYGYTSGTSVATPIASGIAALLLSAYPHLNNQQVRNIILETAGNSSSPDNERGYGLISAARAVSYPNLQVTDNGTRINKMFVSDNNFDPSSVNIFYAAGNNDYSESTMSNDGSVYFFNMPFVPQGSNVSFYFTYTDSTGDIVRDPIENSYHYKEGNLLVSLNISNIPTDYVLSQNYPNPFNSTTKIDFVAAANEKAELVIIDGAGQKVKMLYNGPAEQGVNTVLWDGTSDRGYQCASGVYFYILKIGGKEFGKKMILLK